MTTHLASDVRPTVPRLADDGVVVCLATGPSLCQDDVDYVKGKATVVAVNDAWRLAPWADVLISSDLQWWPHHQWVPEFQGIKVGVDMLNQPRGHGLVVLKHTGDAGIEWSPHGLKSAKNSGGAAINLAVHLGAQRIILLGYDMENAPDGRVHFFGDHPGSMKSRRRPFQAFRELIGTMATPLADRGISVVNCSRRTALTCFPVKPLREVL